MTFIDVQPCMPLVAPIHILIVAIQGVTTVLVAWLTNRAKRRDREERLRNGHDSNGR